MGFLDKLRGKAKDVVEEHGDKIDGGIDKVADFVDDKTGKKYSDKIDGGAEKLKDGIDKLAGVEDEPKKNEPKDDEPKA